MMNKLYEYINFCKFKVQEEPNWNAEFYIKYGHDFHNENQKYLHYGLLYFSKNPNLLKVIREKMPISLKVKNPFEYIFRSFYGIELNKK